MPDLKSQARHFKQKEVKEIYKKFFLFLSPSSQQSSGEILKIKQLPRKAAQLCHSELTLQ